MTDEQSKIHADQVKQLYDNAPLGMIAVVLNAAVLTFILWKAVPHRPLNIWLVCLLSLTLLRAVRVYQYRRRPHAPAEARGWEMQFIIGLALSGLAWGCAVVFLWPPGSLTHQVFLAFVLGGMVAGAVAAFSVVRTALLAFSVPVLTPLIIRFFSFGDEIHVTMGGMILLFAVLVHFMAFRYHSIAVLSLKHRYENVSLVAYLAAANERAEELNADLMAEISERKKAEGELQRHRDHLEDLVRERTDEWSHANARLQEEIAARSVAEALVKESEEYFRSLIENAIDLITVLDSKGNVLFESPSVERLLGYGREELIGRDVFELIHHDDRQATQKAFAGLLRAPGTTDSIELRLLHKNGSWRLFESFGKCMVDENGTGHVIVNSRDNTERKRLEEHIMNAQKLESLGVLAGGIAHDFNNLIAGIKANIDMAMMHANHDKTVLTVLEKAEQASVRAHDLTRQLLIFSAGGAPVKKTVRLNDLIREAANFALRGSKAGCAFSLPEDLAPVEADAGQLRQVIHNIVLNADQAMPHGGMVRITGENIRGGPPGLQPPVSGDFIKISISDQGIGIPKAHLERIFDPYFTTKERGSGLGLATAYTIVKKHGGYITAESVQGASTTISLYLPASPEAVEAPRGKKAGLVFGRGRVLIMDDEDIIRDALGMILKTAGYDVEFSKDGGKAIELYRKAYDEGKPYDVVILDLTVPGGVGGKAAIEKLIEVDPEVRAIASSGYSEDPVMAHFGDYGFLGTIEKPFNIRDMSEIVSRVIAMKRRV